jgi:hypothetical protein
MNWVVFVCLLWFFETESHYEAQSGLKFMIHMYWDYRYAPPHPAWAVICKKTEKYMIQSSWSVYFLLPLNIVYLPSLSDDSKWPDGQCSLLSFLPSQVWFLRVHHQCQQPLPGSISHLWMPILHLVMCSQGGSLLAPWVLLPRSQIMALIERWSFQSWRMAQLLTGAGAWISCPPGMLSVEAGLATRNASLT